MTTELQEPKASITSGIKYPSRRDDVLYYADVWLENKREDDGAEGLWRIHDDLYDLTSWIKNHPGGKMWIEVTKGTDVTEAYESFHISDTPEKILPKFFVRKAKSPRNSQYTFKEDGFYRTLKRKIRTSLNKIPENVANKSKMITDGLLLAFVLTAILSVRMSSFVIGAIAGIFLGMTVIAAHNFFHQKDNFRMYYFDFCFMSSRFLCMHLTLTIGILKVYEGETPPCKDWRISHTMSHHLYTNTIIDMEIILLEPFFLYLPTAKSTLRGIISCIISPGVYFTLFLGMFITRTLARIFGQIKGFYVADILPFLLLATMCILGNRSLTETFLMWIWIFMVGGFYFSLVGVNAAHHHPEIFHDGDTVREDRDWGLAQMDTVMDRHEISGSLFLVLTNFGDHCMHHLFPTVDHAKLEYLYPVLKETCQEFGVEFRMTSQLNLILGQFWQLLRTSVNPFPPGVKWHWYTDAKEKLFSFGLTNVLNGKKLKSS